MISTNNTISKRYIRCDNDLQSNRCVFFLSLFCLSRAFFSCFGLITSRFFLSQALIPNFTNDFKNQPLQPINLLSLLIETLVPSLFELVNEFLQHPQLLYSHSDDDLRTSSCVGGAVAWFQPSPTTGRGGTRIRTAGERTRGAVVYGSHMVPCQLTPVNLTV